MMTTTTTTKKKNMFVKTWERCRSMGSRERYVNPTVFSKSKSWHGRPSWRGSNNKVAPDGCFSVYVGPEKERFAIKAKYANHPLFQMLLEDAEMEYGYTSQGPLVLPCEVDLLYKVLAEIGCCTNIIGRHEEEDGSFVSSSCSPYGGSTYKILTPPPIRKFDIYF